MDIKIRTKNDLDDLPSLGIPCINFGGQRRLKTYPFFIIMDGEQCVSFCEQFYITRIRLNYDAASKKLSKVFGYPVKIFVTDDGKYPDYYLFFKNAEDAMAFKLEWL